MTIRLAFEQTDLASLLDLDLAEPADQADIEAVQEILQRRSSSADEEPARGAQRRGRTRLHLVPGLGTPREG